MLPYEAQCQPETACHLCRRRKVKCDRAYPACNECVQRDQVCSYPAGALKPGPKLGTMQRRKRQRKEIRSRHDGEDQPEWDARAVRSSLAAASNEETEHLDDDRLGSNASGSPRTNCSSDRPRSFSRSREWASLPPIKTGSARDDAAHNNDGGTTKESVASLNIHDLSFILHPSHEGPSPGKDSVTTVSGIFEQQESALVEAISAALDVDSVTLKRAVDVYFDHMVAINLFHEPTFRAKVSSIAIESMLQAQALLVAMLAFAACFYMTTADETDVDGCSYEGQHQQQGEPNPLKPSRFLALAFTKIDAALQECGDEAPPLCLLQALIIATHCQLTLGVRGKAWRSLGMCIRLAYELNLHLVDADRPDRYPAANVDVQQWVEDEERRRAWWATWEMDVFASTIRRTRPAMDWSQMETLLPVEDHYWFQNQPKPSCFMELDAVYRWKVLQESGNESPKAWFLVINSLMKDAQVISSPRSIPRREPAEESQGRHATPQWAGAAGELSSPRQIHCGIYNIYIMTQLARIMIHRYGVFGGRKLNGGGAAPGSQGAAAAAANRGSRSSGTHSPHDGGKLALLQYFEATDNILNILSRSSVDHIRHINPFLSSTIWLASAVQLLRMQFAEDETSRTLIKSKFEALYLTYRRCVSFWDIQTALQQNLEALEAQLERPESTSQNACPKERRQAPHFAIARHSDKHPVIAGGSQGASHKPCSAQLASSANRPSSRSFTDDDRHVLAPELQRGYNPLNNPTASTQDSPARLQDMIPLDYMHMSPQLDRQQPLMCDRISMGELDQAHDTRPPDPAGGFFDPMGMMGYLPHTSRSFMAGAGFANQTPDFGPDWRNLNLLSDIHDLLSGYSSY
ncbi:hypothetical protein TrVFT333_002796 [Trichoderma virens FT-333]|nr:hypothetical protein TrVFT333_002796 [Trichoderma virens FT-333]